MTARVFISYSRDSDEHAERVLELADRLRADGIDCVIDRYFEDDPPAQGWPRWMDEEVEAADAVLVAFTEQYGQRRGSGFESVLILQDLYDSAMQNEKFVPIVFDPADVRHIVKWLRPYSRYNVGDAADYEKLRRRLLDDPAVVMPPLGAAVKRGPRRSTTTQVKLGQLPAAGPLLIGRETEMARLDEAWESRSQHVISVVARGGEGKTNLVRYWLDRMSADSWRGAERVFAWSFFSQGSKDKAASADQFIDLALRFFGEASPESIKSPYERGDRLAHLVGSGRNLLILDGLEPLQYPPGAMEGRLKDPALQTLLAGLSAHNAGLCVITTRESLPELASGRANVSPNIELRALTDEAGAELLQRLGVHGTNAQRAAVSHRLGGHALSLQLLGTYLHEVHDGDVTRAGEVALLDQDPASGNHAHTILESYERWLSGRTLAEDDPGRAEVERTGAPMLAILRLLGLFDRPAEISLIDVLRAEPAIEGLTDPLVLLPHAEWKRALARLRKLKLIDDDKTAIDAHPLIREYFAEQLDENFTDGARDAHRRLFEQLKNSAPELPDTLQEMMPLFAAVWHGCKAGLWQEALDDVFYKRIYRQTNEYSWRKLGAFGAQIQALSAFTSGDSHIPTSHLEEADRAWVLAVLAYSLKALGRHRETRQLMETVLEMRVKQNSWANATAMCDNLVALHLDLGEIARAAKQAEQSLEFADMRAAVEERMLTRISLANTLHVMGVFDAARVAFQDALELQLQFQPQYTLPYSLQGFLHRDFLLNAASPPSLQTIRQIRRDAQTVMKWYEEASIGTLSQALERLTLARTFIFENVVDPQTPSLAESASVHAEEAVSLLRDAGEQSYLVLGLFCRAAVWRTWPDRQPDAYARADKDLAEAEQIADGSGMLRWQIEAALERARLHLALDEKDKAREKLEEAKRLIKKTEAPYVPHVSQWEEWEPPSYINVFKEGQIVGYHRCDADVAALEQALR